MAEVLQAVAAPLARRGFRGSDEGREPAAPRPGGGVDPQRRRGVRRTTILLVVLALALYFGFIIYAVVRGLRAGAVPHATAHAATPNVATPNVAAPAAPAAPAAAPAATPPASTR